MEKSKILMSLLKKFWRKNCTTKSCTISTFMMTNSWKISHGLKTFQACLSQLPNQAVQASWESFGPYTNPEKIMNINFSKSFKRIDCRIQKKFYKLSKNLRKKSQKKIKTKEPATTNKTIRSRLKLKISLHVRKYERILMSKILWTWIWKMEVCILFQQLIEIFPMLCWPNNAKKFSSLHWNCNKSILKTEVSHHKRCNQRKALQWEFEDYLNNSSWVFSQENRQ